MATTLHEAPIARRLTVPRDMWAALAIVMIWVAVLVTAVWGPAIDNSNGAGTNTSSVPSVVVVAVFAALATWPVAKYGFRRREGLATRIDRPVADRFGPASSRCRVAARTGGDRVARRSQGS